MWNFNELKHGEVERYPHEAEFFRLEEPAEALVREVIQNSLDAKKNGETKVSVSFYIGEIENRDARDYLSSNLEQHLKICYLLPDDYKESNRIRFVIVEDFGTTGLDGATGEDGCRPEKGNNFYDFWWREGISGKGGREAGRWGLGKTTFHMISKLGLFFGLTVRQDDSRELLMGKALLKPHRIGSNDYSYYGHFTAENFNPIEDDSIIKDFKHKFSISREDEPGFSLIIPMPVEEITELALIRYVIIHYFYAIMKGILEVEIKTSSGIHEYLTAGNILNIATNLNWQDTSWESVNITELLLFISGSMDTSNIIKLKVIDESLEITEKIFGDKLEEQRNSFTTGNLISFRVPLTVKKIIKKIIHGNSVDISKPIPTFFEIYFKRYPELKQPEEFYVRSGITIPEIREMGTRPVRAILVAADAPITEFLGDCETPAHTKWNEKTEGFKEKYFDAVKTLRFIKKSMGKIVSILDQPPRERQIDFLKEIFFVPQKTKQEEEPTKKTKETVIPPIKRKSPVFQINKIDRGFKINLDNINVTLPIRATVTVAYDIRKGNPFAKYDPQDFNFGSGMLSINSTGCKILLKNQNTIKFEVTDHNFILEVTRFHIARDLVVKVIEEEKVETQV